MKNWINEKVTKQCIRCGEAYESYLVYKEGEKDKVVEQDKSLRCNVCPECR